MSKRLLQKKVFDRKTILNVGKMDRIERIYMSLMQPYDVALSEEDAAYKNVLVRAFAIMSEGHSQAKCIELINEIEDKEHRMTGWRVMKDAEALFGPMMKINKTLEIAILREKLRLMESRILGANDSMDEGELPAKIDDDVLIQIYKEWNKLLDKLPDEEADRLPELPEITFTTNPKALQLEDVEYDEEE